MPDNTGILSVFVFVLFNEFLGAGKSNLVNVFFNFFLGHPNSLIYYAKLLLLFVQLYFNHRIAVFYSFGFTNIG